MSETLGARIHVTGIVQGVGFRPFVYNLARRMSLAGVVRNTSAGVDIEVDGAPAVLEDFVRALSSEAPPLARIDGLTVTRGSANGFRDFVILESASVPEAFQPISPDVAICDDCLRELFDPKDRRYRYPFINCTNCGPRFTIIRDIPYDRPQTTMASFAMCPQCAREYADPTDRRFHAQPIACPVCGPQIWLEPAGAAETRLEGDKALREARRLLAEGSILAVKGLGGFHLACDAFNPRAVAELRLRKLRVDKPFAIMMVDLESVVCNCFVSEAERDLLVSTARPIVLLRRRPESKLARDLAPGQDWLGVMLPYTPLHYLLLERQTAFPEALVMTSGNLSEEPIATENEDARIRLPGLADAFLMHDRDIHVRCDDSVVRVFIDGASAAGESPIYPVRRSRGYAPFPVKLPRSAPPLLAVGAGLKNTFCITNRSYGFLSQHIGDLENYETLRSFESSIRHFEHLFRVEPQAIAYDLHPDYLATRYALRRIAAEAIPGIPVQHHHAHIAACMAEHGLSGVSPVIGVALDGTGYGEDATIWGGEILVADYNIAQRALHFECFPLPGGDAAIRRPARVALALLWSLGMEWGEDLPCVQQFTREERLALRTQLERKLNAPSTSSAGRIFDAAASLAGVRQKINYEAQAAIEFEALADPSEMDSYPFEVNDGLIHLGAAFAALLEDVRLGAAVSSISARFHNGMASGIAVAVGQLAKDTGIREVVLSGGVWQNITLLRRTLSLLEKTHHRVYIHREVPANDGGLSLGQAVIAASRLRSGHVLGSSRSNT